MCRRKNQVTVYTHGFWSMGTAGSVHYARQAVGLTAWCTQTYLRQIRVPKSPEVAWTGMTAATFAEATVVAAITLEERRDTSCV